MAQEKKRWEPPPFVLKKSQQQIEDESKWTPPPFVGTPVEIKRPDYTEIERPQGDIEAEAAQVNAENKSKSGLEKLYEYADKSLFDRLGANEYRPSKLLEGIDESVQQWSENQPKDGNKYINELKNNIRYANTFGRALTGGIEETFSNPIQLALMTLSGGSNALFKGAKEGLKIQNAARKIHEASGSTAKFTQSQTPEKLYQIAKALEFPGRLASGAQVAHGGYRGATGDTWQERIGGGIEAVMGATGLRFKSKYPREYPKTEPKNITPDKIKTKVDTKEQHGPNQQLYFPLRGNKNPIPSSTFKSGPKGTYREGDLIYSPIGGEIPIETAYNHGTIKATKSGSPYVEAGVGDGPPVKPAVNSEKLEALRHYMQGTQEGTIPKGVTFPDYFASIQPAKPNIPIPVEEPIITTPDKPVSFDEILPPTESTELVPDVRQPDSIQSTAANVLRLSQGDKVKAEMAATSNRQLHELGSPKDKFWEAVGNQIAGRTSPIADDGIRIGSMEEDIVNVAERRKLEGREALLPDVRQPLKQGAVFAFNWPAETLQDGSTSGGFDMYHVPTETGDMTTVTADTAIKMGYELPDVRQPAITGSITPEVLPMDRPSQTPENVALMERIPDEFTRERVTKILDKRFDKGGDEAIDITPGANLPDVRQTDPRISTSPLTPYEFAKRDLDERQANDEVIDYEDELANLNEAHGTIDVISNEQQKWIDEVKQANDEGYIVSPPGRPLSEGETVVRTLSDGSKVVTTPNHEAYRAERGLVPDVRQLPSPINSIGDEIINPSADLSTGIDLNEPTTPVRASDQWQEIVDELDARNAPDSEYRNILSTGSKEPLKKRETWRDRVQKYIKMDRAKNPDPNYEPDTDIGFARAKKGGKTGIVISQNVKAAAKELTSGYDGPLEGIMVREALQNVFDAIKKVLGKGTNSGVATVEIDYDRSKPIQDYEGGTITISDTGGGMTRKELETVFSTLNESGKVDELGATGGKGVGAASYMMGGAEFSISTVAVNPVNNSKYRITGRGSPEDFLEFFELKEEVVPYETPTGTTIAVKLAKGQGIGSATLMLNNVLTYSRGIPVTVKSTTPTRNDEITINDGTTDKIVDTRTFSAIGTSDATLRVPPDIDGSNPLDERRYLEVYYLNNGMYQFNRLHHLDEKTPNMPRDVIVDIRPHDKEGTKGYPFPTARESIKDELQTPIKNWINETLVKPAAKNRKSILKELYEGMTPIETTDGIRSRDTAVYDAGGRMTPEELASFSNSPVVKELAGFTDAIIDDIVKFVDNKKVTDRLEKTGLLLYDGAYGIHIPSPIQDTSTILINYLLHASKQIDPRKAAKHAMQTLLHEVAHIGKEAPLYTHSPYKEELTDPRIGEYLQGFFKHQNEHGGLNEGHAEDWMKRLGDVYARYPVARAFDAEDELTRILTDESGGYNSEVQRLLQQYIESRGRAATTEDVLSRTGDESKSTGKGKGNSSGDSEGDGDGIAPTIEESVGRLKEALVAGKFARDKQDLLVGAARSKRAGKIAGVKTRGMAGYQQQLGMLSGPLPKVDTESIVTEQDMDVLIDAISDNGELMPYQEISAKRGLLKLLAGQAPQNSEIALLTKVFGDDELGGLVELHAGLGGLTPNRKLVNNVLHLAKTMKASMDLSGSLRQGLPFIDRKEYWKAFWNMHKYLGSEVAYQGGLEAMRSHPDFHLIMETPLFLAGFKGQGRGQSGNALEDREEQFISEWGDRIPLVKQSQRAYIGFLDELRFNTMVSLMDSARKTGIELSQEQIKYEGTRRETTQTVSTPELDEIAKYVNIFTGRGSLGRFEKMAVEANWFLWSPKFLSSRLTILNPFYYKNASPFVQKQAVRSLLAIAGAGATLLGLAAAGGATVNYDDPTSADFMKARFGKTRMDPWAGLQQNVVLEARILTYLRNAVLFIQGKPIPKNQKYRPGTGYNSRTARDVGIDFAENKISPLANFVSSLADLGKSYEPAGASKLLTNDWNVLPSNRVTKEVINLYSPMMSDTIIDLIKDDPSLFPLSMNTLMGKTAPLIGASMYGSSIQTYDQSTAARQARPRMPRLTP